MLTNIKKNNPLLPKQYPRFTQALSEYFFDGDVISPPSTIDQLSTLPQDQEELIELFNTTAQIFVDAIEFDIDNIYELTLHDKVYLVIGEFWFEADGDLLLIDPAQANSPVYYYAHDEDKVSELAESITELLEEHLTDYMLDRLDDEEEEKEWKEDGSDDH